MDPLGNNKIFAAVLGAALVFMAIRTIPEFLMHHDYPDTPAYFVGEPPAADDEGGEALPFPQESWVAAMDAERGAKVFKKCVSCHNVEAGGANGTGPALYNVVMRQAGSVSDFSYSEAMASAGYEWDWEHLDGFLEKPSRYLPGTKMAFVGLKKPEDRAAVIEYMRTSAANPVARPEAAAVPVSEVAENAADLPNETLVTDGTQSNETMAPVDPQGGSEAATVEGNDALDENEPMTAEDIDEVQ